MPIAEQSIAGLQFLTLQGSVEVEQQGLERFARGSIDGYGYKKLGQRNQPFELVSFVDCASLLDAQSLYSVYLTKQATGFWPLIKDGLAWGNYVVERVTIMPNGMRAQANCAGGINPPSLALLSCRWLLSG